MNVGEKHNASNVYNHLRVLVDVETGESVLIRGIIYPDMGQAFGPVFRSPTQCKQFLEYLKECGIIYPDAIGLETDGERTLEDFYTAYLDLEASHDVQP